MNRDHSGWRTLHPVGTDSTHAHIHMHTHAYTHMVGGTGAGGLEAYLGVLCGDLQNQGQGVVIEVLIQGQQSTMHTTLVEISCVVPQPDRLDPVNHLVIGPDQHIWRAEEETDKKETWLAQALLGTEAIS